MRDRIQTHLEPEGRPPLTLVASEPRQTAVDDLDLLARCVFSRFIAAPRRLSPADIHTASRLLVRCAHAEAFAGRHRLPAIDRDLALEGWVDGKSALARAGLTQPELRRQFEVLKDRMGVMAHFDADLLDIFFPEPLCQAFAKMAGEGPGIFAQRAEYALRLAARTPVRASARRQSGPPCIATLTRQRNTLRHLMRVLVELRGLEHPCRHVARWEAVPPVQLPDVAPIKLDTKGVPITQVRTCLRELNDEIAKRLRLRPEQTEAEALRALPPSRYRGLFRLLRARVILGLLIVTAGRPSAIARLRIGDIDRDHIGPAPDHRAWPVLRLRPAKSLHEMTVRPKPIPPAFVAMIDVYLEYLELHREHELEMDETQSRLSPDMPLLVTNARDLRPVGYHGIRTMASGRAPSRSRNGDKSYERPLIVRTSVANPDVPAEHRPYIGYNAMAYRHTASQLAERAGELWNAEHPTRGADPMLPPSLFATALQDHHPKGDPLRAIYGDRATENAYELLSGRAVEGIWRLIATTDGARKMPDIAAIRQVLSLRDALRSEKGHLRATTEELCGEPVPTDHRDQIPHLTRLVQAMYRQTHLLELCNERLAETELRLQRLRLDERTYIVLPDDAPPGAEDLDLDALETEAPTDHQADPPAPRVREWITVLEMTWITGRERSTVCNWLKGKHLPAQGHRPWDPESVPVDDSLGPNHRRIYVPGIRATFWAEPSMRHRLDEVLSRWPREKNWQANGQPGPRCHASLVLPSASLGGC